MDPNTHSTQQPSGLDRLTVVVDELAAEDLDAVPDSEAARRVLVLRGLLERLEGQWLRELAGVDGRGAAGADQGVPAESTAGWLRHRTRMATPPPTSASGSPAPCTAAPCPVPPRRWPTARAAGACTVTPTGPSPRSHPTDDDNPPPRERRPVAVVGYSPHDRARPQHHRRLR